MIWGKTNKERNAKKTKVGDKRRLFVWLPTKRKDGRWIWWVHANWIKVDHRDIGPHWVINE